MNTTCAGVERLGAAASKRIFATAISETSYALAGELRPREEALLSDDFGPLQEVRRSIFGVFLLLLAVLLLVPENTVSQVPV